MLADKEQRPPSKRDAAAVHAKLQKIHILQNSAERPDDTAAVCDKFCLTVDGPTLYLSLSLCVSRSVGRVIFLSHRWLLPRRPRISRGQEYQR